MPRMKSILLASALLGSSALIGVADAQQAAPPPSTVPAPPATQPPAAGPGIRPPDGAAAPRRRSAAQLRFDRLANMAPADRTAIIDARLAALRAGLELTPDQAKLWPPVESAIRDGFAQLLDLRQKNRNAGPPRDPMDRLSRASQLLSARAAALQKFVAAAQPLYASLDPEQKGRIPMLMGAANEIGGARRPGAQAQGFDEGRGPPPRRDAERQGRNPGAGRQDDRSYARRDDRGDGPTWRERMRERMEQMYGRRDDRRGNNGRLYGDDGDRGNSDNSTEE